MRKVFVDKDIAPEISHEKKNFKLTHSKAI